MKLFQNVRASSVIRSEQYWENTANDLESYAKHAHRKTIEEADVELLMRR